MVLHQWGVETLNLASNKLISHKLSDEITKLTFCALALCQSASRRSISSIISSRLKSNPCQLVLSIYPFTRKNINHVTYQSVPHTDFSCTSQIFFIYTSIANLIQMRKLKRCVKIGQAFFFLLKSIPL